MNCHTDEFRKWHQEILDRLYKNTKAYSELLYRREEYMIKEKMLCCKQK